ncbi:unnamed protein product [Protopolystoma xenopodis]|uniref:Uncharacterized protein n=1 Tax=Protopolystoma xenopodis TaxID=117903 RepID=A0A3S5CRS1_9PLAT|nr:unnamed protein product [Protopolystoma xenopodis]
MGPSLTTLKNLLSTSRICFSRSGILATLEVSPSTLRFRSPQELGCLGLIVDQLAHEFGGLNQVVSVPVQLRQSHIPQEWRNSSDLDIASPEAASRLLDQLLPTLKNLVVCTDSSEEGVVMYPYSSRLSDCFNFVSDSANTSRTTKISTVRFHRFAMVDVLIGAFAFLNYVISAQSSIT